ncbi:MAG: hypothetical protein EBY34_04435, partial [Alphaproteobacteria bacterium]|nr:hypothetical protein [Alphaproteobacteria bacterium]NDG36964.1 hypothetical protein [Alphaproteobacteria bacterium]
IMQSLDAVDTASRLCIMCHRWSSCRFEQKFSFKKTSRCDRSRQINHGQNQSFFLAPVNTTARLSSRFWDDP